MEVKKSKLCFDAKIARRILKKNPQVEAKYCRYCGKLISDKCGCAQPATIIDLKPNRENLEKSIFVFENTEEFQKAFDEVMTEMKSKQDKEPIAVDID